MTTQITWNIEQLERSLPDGLVLTAHWRVTGTDGQYSGTVYGSIGLPANDPADPNFVPYEAITKERYEELARAVAHVDYSKIMAYEKAEEVDVKKELACVGNVCEIAL